MKSFACRIALTCVVLTFLGACAGMDSDGWGSKGNNNVAKVAPVPSDEAPPPNAAPTVPVVATALPAPTQGPATASPGAPSPVLASATGTAVAKVKVAILLPLSGKNAALGHAMLNAAQMAVFDMSGGSFELMPRDTDGSDASAVAASRDAVASGAQLVVGPLFAAQIPGVRSVAEPAGLSMLTLSTDTSLAAPKVFVMGFAPGAQVERVINYAGSQGLKRFAAIVPDSPYGSLVTMAFRSAVARVGGTVVDLQTFDAQHNAAAAVQALTVYRDRIDAVFIPVGGDDLGRIGSELQAAGFDNHRVRILGTGLWDEGNVAQRSNFLVGAWYAAPDPSARQNFMTMYQKSYGQEPPRLATLAYDATALAAVLTRRGERFDRASLTNPNGFAGVDGIFRLTDQGLVERGLAINEIEPATEKVVSPAPVTFVGQH